jgi:hypothetical protein
MTVCPIAIVASCKQCPVFKVCPAKGILGDYVAEPKPEEKSASHKKPASGKK